MEDELHGDHYAIVVVAEGAAPKGAKALNKGVGEVGRQDVLLGGIGGFVAQEISKRTGKDARSMVLGHL